MTIRIVKRPIGEAPDDVRDAWIGLSLPVVPHFSHIVKSPSSGVLSGPRTRLAKWFNRLLGRGRRMPGYIVDTAAAVHLLEKRNPRAAEWWRTNTPHLFQPGRGLLFDRECCVVEDPPFRTATSPRTQNPEDSQQS
jgi:hypothetical protein